MSAAVATCKFEASGWCKYGEGCKFKHLGLPVIKPVCTYYVKGVCRYGNTCFYKHATTGTIKMVINGVEIG